MTSANTQTGAVPKTAQPSPRYRLPDPPERDPDDMTSAKHLALTGNAHHLIHHFDNPDTTLVAAERYIVLAPHPGRDAIRRSPDLLIAFNVDPQAYEESNGYIISEQSKPPDFVLEVASPRTGHVDVGEKRDDYAALGILEYWRFDETETGQYHGARLAGERLENGQYAPIPIDELDNDVLQGYSPVLNLRLRWEHGRLGWHDPATGRHILTYEDQRDRADHAEDRAHVAEARVRALEAELNRLRNP